MGLNYKDAGVDITAGEEAVKEMSEHVKSTFNENVLTGLGTFGALYKPDFTNCKEPVLVSGSDGVGTKLKVAFKMDKHNTIGIDLVAMSVNDVLSQGAKPLFFLDYLATGKLKPHQAADVVKGIATGCKQAGCALVGGETAEMPGFYDEGEYDLAGFAVGMVARNNIITGENIRVGNAIIGLESDGLHSNGFSLARKVFFEHKGYNVQDNIDGLDDILGEELLQPTRIYVKPILNLLAKYSVQGIAHITGGGLIENIPRILPVNTTAEIDKNSWSVQQIFRVLQDKGDIAEKEMYRTFNMGIGMVVIVEQNQAGEIVEFLQAEGEKAYIIGKVKKGNSSIELI